MLIELYSPDIKHPIKGGYEYYYRGGGGEFVMLRLTIDEQ